MDDKSTAALCLWMQLRTVRNISHGQHPTACECVAWLMCHRYHTVPASCSCWPGGSPWFWGVANIHPVHCGCITAERAHRAAFLLTVQPRLSRSFARLRPVCWSSNCVAVKRIPRPSVGVWGQHACVCGDRPSPGLSRCSLGSTPRLGARYHSPSWQPLPRVAGPCAAVLFARHCALWQHRPQPSARR